MIFAVAFLIVFFVSLIAKVSAAVARNRIRARDTNREITLEVASTELSGWLSRFTHAHISRPMLLYIGVIVGGFLYLMFSIASIAIIGGVATPVILVRLRTFLLQRQMRTELRDLALMLEDVAREMQTGVTLSFAISHYAQQCPRSLQLELERINRSIERGNLIETALLSWGERVSFSSLYRYCLLALVAAIRSGGAVVDVCRDLAEVIRQQETLRREITALTTQARTSAQVLMLLPIGFGLASSATNKGARDFLFHSPVGSVIFIIALSLEVIGYWWLIRMTKVSV